MAENLILSDLTKPGKTALNLVLDDLATAAREESTDAAVFWRFEDEPGAEPQLLGSAAAGKSLTVPFDMTHGRAIRLFLVSKTATGNLSAADVREAVQMVFDPNENPPGVGMPPTSATAEELAPDQARILWVNNGGTGDNKIERRRGTSGAWGTAGTVSSATDHFDDSAVTISGNYYYRVYNEDVAGYSNEVIIHLTA